MRLTRRRQVCDIAARLGLPPIPEDWRGCDAVWPILETMRAEGAVVLIKLDGERTGPDDNGPYTALATSKPLSENAIRTDSDTLEDALAHVIIEYARRCWPHSRADS